VIANVTIRRIMHTATDDRSRTLSQ
jgi:hypothetical protein